MIMTNESFDNVFDSSLVDYSKDFEEQDKFQYDKQCAIDWVFTNCADVNGNKLQKENVVYNPDKTIDILKNGLCMRGHNIGKVGRSWSYTVYGDVGEEIEFIPEYVNFRVCWGSCDLGHNHLKSLRGCPRVIMPDKINVWGSSSQGDFWCNSNDLRDLEYFPEFIGGSFDCCDNKNMVSLDGINLDWIRNDLAQENSGHYGQIPYQLYDEWTKLINTAKKLGPTEEKFRYDTKIFDKYGISKFANVNESFNNVFDSSLIDYSEDFEKQDRINLIKNWVEQSTIKYTGICWGPLIYGEDYKINDDFTIDTFCNTYINSPDRWYGYNHNNDLMADYPTELPDYIQFNVAHDNFIFTDKSDIKSLRGCPKQVFGDFYCKENSLTTLEGGPEVVNGNYNVCCNKLTSLKGAPNIIGVGTGGKRVFFNAYGNKLTSLEYGPNIVYGTYSVEKNKLTSLKGFPQYTECLNIKFNNIDKDEFWKCYNENYVDELDLTPKQEILLGLRPEKKKIVEAFDNVFDSSLIDYSEDFELQDKKIEKWNQVINWLRDNVYLPDSIIEKTLDIVEKKNPNVADLDDIADKFIFTINDDLTIDAGKNFKESDLFRMGLQHHEPIPDYIQFNHIYGSCYIPNEYDKSDPGMPKIVDKIFAKRFHTDWIFDGPLADKNYLEDLKECNNIQMILGESFENVFDSSLIDYSKDFENSDTEYKKKQISDWCKRHVFWYNKHRLKLCGVYSGQNPEIQINDDFSIDVFDDMYIDYTSTMAINYLDGSAAKIQFPEFIKFNKIHGDMYLEGDDFGNVRGFPEVVEGNLNLSYNPNIKTYEGFPKSVGSLEMVECSIKDFEKYMPDIYNNPTLADDEIYIQFKDKGTYRNRDHMFFKNLVKKYKDSVSYVETEYYSASYENFDKVNESFDNVFDSSLLDYSKDFEKQDELQAAKIWVESHIVGININSTDFILNRDGGDKNFDKSLAYKYSIKRLDSGEFIIDVISGNVKVILDKDAHEIPYKIGSVFGDFGIGHLESAYGDECYKYQLWSLKNMPAMVYGNFNITDSSLENLEGSPAYVSGDYIAAGCHLKSIKGISKRIYGEVILSYNDIQDSSEDFTKYLNTDNQSTKNIIITQNKTDLWSLGYDKINDINISISK